MTSSPGGPCSRRACARLGFGRRASSLVWEPCSSGSRRSSDDVGTERSEMNARVFAVSGSFLFIAATLIACGGDSPSSGLGLGGDGGADGPTGQGPGVVRGPNGAVSECGYDDDEDRDGDGFSSKNGDCNDCNAGINPGAHDIVGNGVDED